MSTRQRRALLHQIFDYYSVANTRRGRAGTIASSSKTLSTVSDAQYDQEFVWYWPLRFVSDSIVGHWKRNKTYEHPFFATKRRVFEAKRHELLEMYRLSLLGDETFKIDAIKASKIRTANLRRRVYLRIRRDSRRRKIQSMEIQKSRHSDMANATLSDEDSKVLELLITIGHSLRCQRMLGYTNSVSKLKPFGFLYDMKNEHLLPRAKFKGHISIAKTSNPTQVQDALSLLKDENVLGFDTETSQSNKEEKQSPSLMQISSAHTCVLIQIDTNTLPLELVEFLENSKIVKTGVGVLNDARDLTRSFENLKQVNGLVELQTWAEKGLSCKPVSLKALTGIFMTQNLYKPRKTVMSDWSVDRLNSDQRNYAATDAWVGREIFFRMKEFTERRGLSQKFCIPQSV
eukprot:g2604.t1